MLSVNIKSSTVARPFKCQVRSICGTRLKQLELTSVSYITFRQHNNKANKKASSTEKQCNNGNKKSNLENYKLYKINRTVNISSLKK